VAGFSSTSKDFLEQNGSNIIRLSQQGQAQLPLFEKYAPEYPCLLDGIVGAIPLEAEAFRGYTLHINLEPLPRQPRGYTPSDQPAYAERGENRISLDQCRTAIRGGYGQHHLPPDSLVPPLKDGVSSPLGKNRAAPGPDLSSGFAGTSSERDVVGSLAAPTLGVPARQVPDVATLLFGPLARGSRVSLG
jgi:phospholipid/cholesterol/gamma-HCH transport system substrate-binding protein